MKNFSNGSATLLIILLVLVALGGFLYFNVHRATPSENSAENDIVFNSIVKNETSTAQNQNLVFNNSYIRILSSWGPCAAADGCHETYELNSDGQILYNNLVKGSLSSGKAQDFLKTAQKLYQNNMCTSFDVSDTFESYELNINGKIYKFGGLGCKEMQSIMDSIKSSIGVK